MYQIWIKSISIRNFTSLHSVYTYSSLVRSYRIWALAVPNLFLFYFYFLFFLFFFHFNLNSSSKDFLGMFGINTHLWTLRQCSSCIKSITMLKCRGETLQKKWQTIVSNSLPFWKLQGVLGEVCWLADTIT